MKAAKEGGMGGNRTKGAAPKKAAAKKTRQEALGVRRTGRHTCLVRLTLPRAD